MYIVIKAGYLREWRNNEVICWQTLDISFKHSCELGIGDELIILSVSHPLLYTLYKHVMVLALLNKLTEISKILKQYKAYGVAVANR